MAQDRAGPWSRWDGIPAQSASSSNNFVNNRFFDTGNGVGSGIGTSGSATYIRTSLVDQRVNAIDPSFYDCIYGIQNSAVTVVEQCYKDLGCCATGCCKNSEWNSKYAAAVALISIFGFLVILAVVIWLIVWLMNRAKDKRMKRQLINENSNMSPSQSSTSLAQPVPNGFHYGTGPYQTPPNNGYRY
ncbi:unnamed protein product [Auanema sp. JU1783]|nr:unnamed protein product [Auanema sp. JU1783]